jgi:hypothetical protein
MASLRMSGLAAPRSCAVPTAPMACSLPGPRGMSGDARAEGGAKGLQRHGLASGSTRMETESLAQLLAAAVSPMLVISAAGLLLLSMTNRYGRVIDRARAYGQKLGGLPGEGEETAVTRRELAMVWKRARLLRLSITLAIVSVLCVVLTVFGLFIHLLTHLEIASVVLVLFAATLLTLAASLVVFLRDMTLSLHALDLEIQNAGVKLGGGD